MNQENIENFLQTLFDKTWRAASPEKCVPAYLPKPPKGKTVVIGAGKASAAMAQVFEDHWTQDGRGEFSGKVLTRYGHGAPTKTIEIIEASHPVPDAAGLEGAKQIVELVSNLTADDLVVCLISGGGSSLLTAPARGISLAEKQDINQQLLMSGAPIDEMNCVRKHLSRIKGGRLAAAAFPGRMLTLAISDVPHDDTAAIGSGPTVGDPTTLTEAREVIERYGIDASPEIVAALANPANETPQTGAEALKSSAYTLVAKPVASLKAAASIASHHGYRVDILGDSLEGEARDVARFHAAMARDAKARRERVAILSGGELTVTIKGNGNGGPNQEYALALAVALDGASEIVALAGDTDGTDGGKGLADDPAGAIVLPETAAKARAANLNPAAFLDNNDSTGFFDAVSDLIRCGPTQTNVNDVRILLISPE